MPLLNYTTSVPVSRTVAHVQKLLVGAGARTIAWTYDDDGLPVGITFATETPNGPRQFVVPVRWQQVHAVLSREAISSSYKTEDHALRVAWRIVKDWLEAQLAIIQSEMVTLDQVMLPYMTDTQGTTVYDLYVDRQLALGAG